MSSFAIDVARWVAQAKENQDLIVRKIAIEAFRRVILKTPVDTGRARGNWQCEIESLPTASTLNTDPTGGKTIAAMEAVARQVKAGDVIYLANNVIYITALEEGHSKQAPNGMVAITVAEFQGIADSAVRAMQGAG